MDANAVFDAGVSIPGGASSVAQRSRLDRVFATETFMQVFNYTEAAFHASY